MFTPSLVLNIIHPIALISWLALLFFPKHTLTEKIVISGGVPILFSLIYCSCVLFTFFSSAPIGSFDGMLGIRKLFASDWGLLAAWVHFMAFDLLIAIQVMKEFPQRSILVRAPILVLLFIFGPFGWLISRLVTIRSRRIL